jgi:calcineurin-like phosphoesterase family protein
MIFFTSDLHLNHSKIIDYCNRPFSSIEEMNETLIQRWNDRVCQKDTIYVLGDLVFGNPIPFIERLNGIVYIIPGSHDKQIRKLSNCYPNMNQVLPALTERKFVYGDNEILIVMCHYSMRKWNKSHYGSWHLWGHSHGNLPPFGLSFDVGVDTNNFFPYSLDDVVAKMKTLSREFVLEAYR